MAEGIIAHASHYVRTLLWSNNAPVASGTNIELNSSDYDELEVHYVTETSSSAPYYDIRVEKGRDICLTHSQVVVNSMTDTFIMSRKLVRNSDTSYTAGNGLIFRVSGAFDQAAHFVIPLRIYGVKYIG